MAVLLKMGLVLEAATELEMVAAWKKASAREAILVLAKLMEREFAVAMESAAALEIPVGDGSMGDCGMGDGSMENNCTRNSEAWEMEIQEMTVQMQ